MTVAVVKEKSAPRTPSGIKLGWEAAGMKLIYRGKVLDNVKSLASCGIGEDDFMVAMCEPAAAALAARE
jgi:hypothetical protein